MFKYVFFSLSRQICTNSFGKWHLVQQNCYVQSSPVLSKHFLPLIFNEYFRLVYWKISNFHKFSCLEISVSLFSLWDKHAIYVVHRGHEHMRTQREMLDCHAVIKLCRYTQNTVIYGCTCTLNRYISNTASRHIRVVWFE